MLTDGGRPRERGGRCAIGEGARRPTARAHGGRWRLGPIARALCCVASRPLGHAVRRPDARRLVGQRPTPLGIGRQQFSTQDRWADGRGCYSASKQVNLILPSPIGQFCRAYLFFVLKLEKLTHEIIYAPLCRLNLPASIASTWCTWYVVSNYHFLLINCILHIAYLIPFDCPTLQLNSLV